MAKLRGPLSALIAYGVWGLVPLFWKTLEHIKASEILFFRSFWALWFFLFFVFLYKKQRDFLILFNSPRTLVLLLSSAFLIFLNWGVFIYAVNKGEITQASMGYFLTPLCNVYMGLVFLRESLSRAQRIALLLALAAGFMSFYSERNSAWIAPVLALSFSCYGFIRKHLKLESIWVQSSFETALVLPLAFCLLWFLFPHQKLDHYLAYDTKTHILLFFSGVITAIPLYFFARAAQELPFSTLGFFQYLAPSLQFLIGAFFYHEPIGQIKLLSFGLVWLGLLLVAWEQMLRLKNKS